MHHFHVVSRQFLLFFFFCICLSSCQEASDSKVSKPNIVIFYVDDLGYGDISINGQKHFQTPNIDHLAAEGMLFTQHYSGATVCAPSRSALASFR